MHSTASKLKRNSNVQHMSINKFVYVMLNKLVYVMLNKFVYIMLNKFFTLC
jgi:hypothetical protein